MRSSCFFILQKNRCIFNATDGTSKSFGDLDVRIQIWYRTFIFIWLMRNVCPQNHLMQPYNLFVLEKYARILLRKPLHVGLHVAICFILRYVICQNEISNLKFSESWSDTWDHAIIFKLHISRVILWWKNELPNIVHLAKKSLANIVHWNTSQIKPAVSDSKALRNKK